MLTDDWFSTLYQNAVVKKAIMALTRLFIVGWLVGPLLHIWSAVSLTRTSRRARATDYENLNGVQLDYAARTMRWSSALIAISSCTT